MSMGVNIIHDFRCEQCGRPITGPLCECGSKMIAPQQGPQYEAMANSADILVFGGGRGGGKTHYLLLEALRNIHNARFEAVIFRRKSTELRQTGGPWVCADGIYPLVGGKPKEHKLIWEFPSGARVRFSHMEHLKNRKDWLGAEIPLIMWDQIETFLEEQFWFLMGSNRSTCGVPPYCRATCNPVPREDGTGGWVHELIEWWIDRETGYPIPERSGVHRWLLRLENELHWFDTKAQATEFASQHMPERDAREAPRSLTFIPATLDNNAVLMQKDPGYRGKLLSMPRVERERMLGGNWNVKDTAGELFKSEWFDEKQHPDMYVDFAKVDGQLSSFVRFWDKAATKGGTGARTAGVLVARGPGGFYIVDVKCGRWSALEREQKMLETAHSDRKLFGDILIVMEREANSGGKSDAQWSISNLAGFNARSEPPDGNKIARAYPLSAQFEAGTMRLVRQPWNRQFVEELCAFPDARLKDQVDAASGAFSKLVGRSGPPTINRPLLVDIDSAESDPEDDEELDPLPVSWSGLQDDNERFEDDYLLQRWRW